MFRGYLDDAARSRRLAAVVLAAAMVAAAALLLWAGRGLTFFVDEWGFGYLSRQGSGPETFLHAANGHMVVLPVLLTRASLEIFGATTTLPLRLLAIALHLGVGGLLYAFLRRWLGAWGALAPAILVLFLGVAADIFVGSHALPIQIAVATGLGAWLLIERESRVADLAASFLLLCGIASNGFALPFIAGAAVLVAPAPGGPLRRLWVPALPVGVYAIWWLGYGGGGGEEGGASLANVGGLPAYAFDSLAATLAAITGLFTDPGAEQQTFILGPGQAFAALAIGALVYLIAAKEYRPPRQCWAFIAAIAVYWLATGLVADPARQPESGRYLYAGAILLFLVLAPAIAELARPRAAVVVLAAVCLVGLAPNLREIDYAGDFFRAQSDIDRATLAAVDFGGDAIPGEVRIEEKDAGVAGQVPDLGLTVAAYREGKRRWGSPALTTAELEVAHGTPREAADRFLGRALGLTLSPVTRSVRNSSGEGGHGCRAFVPWIDGQTPTVAIPAGGIWIKPAPGPPVAVAVRRFADTYSVTVGNAIGGRPAALLLPPGEVGQGWDAQLGIAQTTLVCGL